MSPLYPHTVVSRFSFTGMLCCAPTVAQNGKKKLPSTFCLFTNGGENQKKAP